MTLAGANNFSENSNSTIYTINSQQTGQYSIVMPKNTDKEISMLIDLNMKPAFDSVINNSMTKESLVQQINEEYTYINNTYPSGVLVFPMLDINFLTSSINSGDKQKIFDETKKIGSITSEIYKKLNDAGVDKSRINQKIIIVEKTDVDNKFVSWLEEQMPNFVDGVSYDELKNKQSNQPSSSDPFASINPFTGEASKVQTAPPTNDIFASAPIPQSQIPEEQNIPKEQNIPEQANDIFSQPKPDTNQPAPATPTNTNEQNDIFEPKPIQNSHLETTQVLQTAPEQQNQTTSPTTPTTNTTPNVESEESQVNELDKKSGGFANLLILLVILVVVTVVSIELGKFLYNTFGA